MQDFIIQPKKSTAQASSSSGSRLFTIPGTACPDHCFQKGETGGLSSLVAAFIHFVSHLRPQSSVWLLSQR